MPDPVIELIWFLWGSTLPIKVKTQTKPKILFFSQFLLSLYYIFILISGLLTYSIVLVLSVQYSEKPNVLYGSVTQTSLS